jgi:lactam utilization protein B
VEAFDVTISPLSFQTICVHGDTPGAPEMIGEIRKGLKRAKTCITAEIIENQYGAAR